jgi:hypothetical protein
MRRRRRGLGSPPHSKTFAARDSHEIPASTASVFDRSGDERDEEDADGACSRRVLFIFSALCLKWLLHLPPSPPARNRLLISAASLGRLFEASGTWFFHNLAAPIVSKRKLTPEKVLIHQKERRTRGSHTARKTRPLSNRRLPALLSQTPKPPHAPHRHHIQTPPNLSASESLAPAGGWVSVVFSFLSTPFR